jgi:hypothetical protein
MVVRVSIVEVTGVLKSWLGKMIGLDRLDGLLVGAEKPNRFRLIRS